MVLAGRDLDPVRVADSGQALGDRRAGMASPAVSATVRALLGSRPGRWRSAGPLIITDRNIATGGRERGTIKTAPDPFALTVTHAEDDATGRPAGGRGEGVGW